MAALIHHTNDSITNQYNAYGEKLVTPHRRDSRWQLCASWKHSRAKPRWARCGESVVEAPFCGGRQPGFNLLVSPPIED
jgi:hypothetical protein